MKKRTLALFPLAAVLLSGCATWTLPTPGEMEDAAARRSPVIARTAPDFRLLNQEDKWVALRDLRGTWCVLYFYPKDDTPGCQCQATQFTRLLQRFKRMDARVIGISEDPPESHREFIHKYGLSLDLLSDPSHETMKAYGAWVQAWIGREDYHRVIRTTYLIDPDGIIRYHWPEVIPRGHADRVRAKLDRLQRGSYGRAKSQP